MKKLLTLTLTISVLLALAACNATPEVAVYEEPRVPFAGFTNYVTFGDTFVIDDAWEFTFLEAPVVMRPVREPLSGELDSPLGASFRWVYEQGIVRFPVTLTNVSSMHHRLGIQIPYDVFDPYGPQIASDVAVARALMRPHGVDWEEMPYIPAIGVPMWIGRTVEGYIFAAYDGDGDYWIQLSDVVVRLPVEKVEFEPEPEE